MDIKSNKQKTTILAIFGTRPEAIKMAPLIKEMEQRPEFRAVVCVTAQHREMLDQVLSTFSISPAFDLNIMHTGQTLSSVTAGILSELTDVLTAVSPQLVLVHGDTTTAFAAALAAFYLQVPVGHVEAGLRTFDKYAPYPEEMNRILIGRIAELHFAPTQANRENLLHEGITDNIFVTGNTVIDAIKLLARADYQFRDPLLKNIDFSKHILLLTTHRRENLGAPLRQIYHAVLRVLEENPDVIVVYPVHKNPLVSGPAQELLCNHSRIILTEPLETDDMHNLIMRCYFVLTDSGGMQEEAPAFGKPVLVLRTKTERPEAVAMGTAQVVGVEAQAITNACNQLLHNQSTYEQMAQAINPYGDGHASERICNAISKYFGGKRDIQN